MPKTKPERRSLRQRLGLWLLRRETKSSRVAQLIASGMGGDAVWSDQRFETQCKEAYLLNVIGFRAVFLVADSVGAIQWRVQQRKKDGTAKDVTKHRIVDLLDRPNPYESMPALVGKLVSYLLLNGNVFNERITEGDVTELYAHPPWRVGIELNKQTGAISKYIYTVSGRTDSWDVDPVTGDSDLLHIKFFHPTDDYFGFSPAQACGREIDTFNEATTFNMRLLQNEARPGLLMMFKGMLTDEEYERIENTVKTKWSGSENAGRAMIVEGDASVQPYGYSPAELQFIEGNREAARRICYALGVPPMLLGIPGDNTYSNYQEARLAFWEDTVIPLAQRLAREWSRWLFNADADAGMFISPDANNVPALQGKKEQQWQRAQTTDFLTINEKRELCGYAPVDGGDVMLINATMIPLAMAGQQGAQAGEDEAQEEEERAIRQLAADGYGADAIAVTLGIDAEDVLWTLGVTEAKPYPNEHACRVNDPGKYERMRRKRGTGTEPDIIYGITRAGGVEVQAYRYPTTRFTVDAARKHCSGKGRFDAAAKCELIEADEE